jgi:hypothetical protein
MVLELIGYSLFSSRNWTPDIFVTPAVVTGGVLKVSSKVQTFN